MTSDPLLLEATRLIGESKAKHIEALCDSVFSDMYEVGKVQGRIQGLKLALQAIDDAARQLYEEEKLAS